MPDLSSIRRAAPALQLSCVALAVLAHAMPSVADQRNTPSAPTTLAAPQANATAEALMEFQKRLQAYLQLREDLGKKLKPLSTTASAAELANRQDALAAALKGMRKSAKRGDMIPPAAAALITKIVQDDFRTRSATATRGALAEVPAALRPAVNKSFPDDAALATVPPLLLNNLPRLPDNLQYRFCQRDLVLLDGDTRIIIDYLVGVLPAH